MPRSPSDTTKIALRPLAKDFFARPTLVVAPQLLGKILATSVRGVLTAGRIVEVEAYLDERDLASHAAKGHTKRNALMFGPPGHAYVYLIYGMHHCVNAVTEEAGVAGAVLIRAIEPLCGERVMARRRARSDRRELASGPGKLCQALAIDRTMNGESLWGPRLFICEGDSIEEGRIVATPRIGVDYSGVWASEPFRFVVRDDPYASKRLTSKSR